MLGKKVKDKITGFTGIAIGHAKYLTGCDQYGVTPPVGADGKVNETQWFDAGRIEVVDDGITAKSVEGEKNGGPNRDCPR